MELFLPILAETETNLPKLIFGLIFIAIWLTSALVSWLNKQQQEQKRRAAQARDRMPTQASALRQHPGPVARQAPVPPRPPQRIAEGLAQRFPDVLLPPAPAQRMPPPIPRQPVPPKPTRRTPKAVPSLKAKRPAPQMQVVSPARIVSAPPAAQVVRPPSPSINATAISTWLTPATLRQQFILTEILQPPLALRNETDHA